MKRFLLLFLFLSIFPMTINGKTLYEETKMNKIIDKITDTLYHTIITYNKKEKIITNEIKATSIEIKSDKIYFKQQDDSVKSVNKNDVVIVLYADKRHDILVKNLAFILKLYENTALKKDTLSLRIPYYKKILLLDSSYTNAYKKLALIYLHDAITDSAECYFSKYLYFTQKNYKSRCLYFNEYSSLGDILYSGSHLNEINFAIDYYEKFIDSSKICNCNNEKDQFDVKVRIENLMIKREDIEVIITDNDLNIKRLNFLKSMKGKWFSSCILGQKMIPAWIFDFDYLYNENGKFEYVVKMHKGSRYYNHQYYINPVTPKILNDSTLFFRFQKDVIEETPYSRYYLQTICNEVSNPMYAYLATQNINKLSQKEIEEIKQRNAEMQKALKQKMKNDRQKGIKSIQEFYVTRISDSILLIKVRIEDIIKTFGKPEENNESVINYLFYKIRDDEPFAILGNNNTIVTNHKSCDEVNCFDYLTQARKHKMYINRVNNKKKIKKKHLQFTTDSTFSQHLLALDSIGFYKWLNKKYTAKQALEGTVIFAGIIIPFAGAMLLNSTAKMIVKIGEALYEIGVNNLPKIFSSTVKMDINSQKWNKVMMNKYLNNTFEGEQFIYQKTFQKNKKTTKHD